MNKVVVIGSNSFSGSHFISHLLQSSVYHIIGLSRSAEKKTFFLPYKRQDLSNFEFHKMDLNNDMDQIIKLIDDSKPEYIVNFASQSIVGESWKYPEHWYNTNVLSIVKLTNILKTKKYLKKYVHISTPEVYGSCSHIVKEDAKFNPSTPYAASRAAADVFIQLLVKNFDFPAVFTRAANVYGPYQQLFKIIPRSVIYIKKGRRIPLHGGGEARRSFIHIKDVCTATKKIMEDSRIGGVYHLSTDRLTPIREIARIICDKMNVSFDASVENIQTRLGLDNAYFIDSKKTENEFGWKPIINLEDGIDEVIAWINENWQEISKEPLEYVHQQ